MLFHWAEDIIRSRFAVVEDQAGKKQMLRLLTTLLCFGFFYGTVMGFYSLIYGHRFLQMFYSAIKVPLLLLATFSLSLPFFFVFNSLLGLRQDFSRSLRALLATQAGLTIILSSLSPVTLFWYVSFDDYNAAILFNAVIFGASSILAQIILFNLSRPLIQKNPRHRITILSWLVIYAFVGIQMGWVLRPFIGSLNSPTQFFRQEAWGNAYMVLINMISRLISG